jgi:hypothetical protein
VTCATCGMLLVLMFLFDMPEIQWAVPGHLLRVSQSDAQLGADWVDEPWTLD